MNRSRLQMRMGITAVLVGTCASMETLPAQEPDTFTGIEVSQQMELDTLRAQSGNTQITVQSNQDLSASVTGSSFTVDTLNSGSVTIAEHALDNFSGIGLFNIVTGNNNAVNSAIGVTFNLQ